MKNIIKSTIIVLIAIFGLSSCDQTVERLFYNENNPEGYSFYQRAITTEFTLANNDTYNVVLCRTNASQATSIPLKITESTGNFSLATPSISFETGKYEAVVSIKYALKNLLPSTQYEIKLQIPSDKISFGSDSILTIQGMVNVPLTWKKVGSGLFYSQWFDDPEEEHSEEWRQDLYQSNEFAAVYMLPNCYYPNYNLQFILNANNSITYSNQPTGYMHVNYGMISWSMPASTAATQPYKNGNRFYFVPRFIVSAGSFGQVLEMLTLDE